VIKRSLLPAASDFVFILMGFLCTWCACWYYWDFGGGARYFHPHATNPYGIGWLVPITPFLLLHDVRRTSDFYIVLPVILLLLIAVAGGMYFIAKPWGKLLFTLAVIVWNMAGVYSLHALIVLSV
jgi:hypothetical protein